MSISCIVALYQCDAMQCNAVKGSSTLLLAFLSGILLLVGAMHACMIWHGCGHNIHCCIISMRCDAVNDSSTLLLAFLAGMHDMAWVWAYHALLHYINAMQCSERQQHFVACISFWHFIIGGCHACMHDMARVWA